MANYCSVCGRKLTKTIGPIGPKCLEKMKPRRNKRFYKTTKQMARQYDIYKKEKGEIIE